MSNNQTQRWRASPPKAISTTDFQSLVEGLSEFLPGLETSQRTTKAKVITSDELGQLEGEDCWKVYQPYVFHKIEHLQFELTLQKAEANSCELHVEFRKNHILLSVSDIGTGWRDAVFEEIERRLKKQGLFKGEFINKLTSTVIRLQNILIVLGASLLILTIIDESINFKYFAISLIATGSVPAISDIFRLYLPPKPISVLEEKPAIPAISVEKIAMWVGISSGVVSLAKELCSLIGSGP